MCPIRNIAAGVRRGARLLIAEIDRAPRGKVVRSSPGSRDGAVDILAIARAESDPFWTVNCVRLGRQLGSRVQHGMTVSMDSAASIWSA